MSAGTILADLFGSAEPAKLRCKVDGCERTGRFTLGFCDAHYQRFCNGRPMDTPIIVKTRRHPGMRCRQEGCDRGIAGLGYCGAHYGRLINARKIPMDAPIGKVNRGTTIDMLRAHAKMRGGECLSDRWDGVRSKYEWKCHRGHRWTTTWHLVGGRGTWCPHCPSSTGERISRFVMEQMFGASFPRCRPDWLRSPISRRPLELDGYNDGMRMAFEYQGTQHYEAFGRHSENEVSGTKERDIIKRRLCWDHGVALVIVHEFTDHQDVEGTLREIERDITGTAADRGYLKIPGRWWKQRPTDFAVIRADVVQQVPDEAHKIAAERGGECLSPVYVPYPGKMQWRCAAGHTWFIQYNSVKNNGSWCNRCSKTTCSIEEARELAEQRGGQCLSSKYVTGNGAKLLWQCASGHVWATQFNEVKRGHWCRLCRLGGTIDQAREIAAHRGGECLSEEYITGPGKMQWRCATGHAWLARFESIKRGTWCAECARRRTKDTRQQRLFADQPATAHG